MVASVTPHWPEVLHDTLGENFEQEKVERLCRTPGCSPTRKRFIANQANIVKNQKAILANQSAIRKNQKTILANQGRSRKTSPRWVRFSRTRN